MFHCTRRMFSWRTWSFFASQISFGRTLKIYKIVSSSDRNFLKKFFWSLISRFWHRCRKRLPKNWKFFTQKQKREWKTCSLRINTFCPKVLLWIHAMRSWQLCQNCFAKKPSFSCSVPKVRNDLISSKIFSSKCSAGHVECLFKNLEFLCQSKFSRKNHEKI